jgi:hypothetical protein
MGRRILIMEKQKVTEWRPTDKISLAEKLQEIIRSGGLVVFERPVVVNGNTVSVTIIYESEI